MGVQDPVQQMDPASSPQHHSWSGMSPGGGWVSLTLPKAGVGPWDRAAWSLGETFASGEGDGNRRGVPGGGRAALAHRGASWCSQAQTPPTPNSPGGIPAAHRYPECGRSLRLEAHLSRSPTTKPKLCLSLPSGRRCSGRLGPCVRACTAHHQEAPQEGKAAVTPQLATEGAVRQSGVRSRPAAAPGSAQDVTWELPRLSSAGSAGVGRAFQVQGASRWSWGVTARSWWGGRARGWTPSKRSGTGRGAGLGAHAC